MNRCMDTRCTGYAGYICPECGQRITHSAKEPAIGLHDFRCFRFLSSLLSMFSLMDGFRYKTERADNTVHVWMIRADKLQHTNVQLDDPDDFRDMIRKIILFAD